MLDKSKKVGRFRRRDRGVSHVFAIFFCGTNFSAISFIRFLSRACRFTLQIFTNTNYSRIYHRFVFSFIVDDEMEREKEIKWTVLEKNFTQRTRRIGLNEHLRFIVDDWPVRKDRFDTWNDHRRIRIVSPTNDRRSRHCFHVRTQKLDDAYNYDGRTWNIKYTSVFVCFGSERLPRDGDKVLSHLGMWLFLLALFSLLYSYINVLLFFFRNTVKERGIREEFLRWLYYKYIGKPRLYSQIGSCFGM